MDAIAGLGPWNDHDGRWCCGLRCDPGLPCPFGLKLKPRKQAQADRHPGAATPVPDP
jgi:hypothetical protein